MQLQVWSFSYCFRITIIKFDPWKSLLEHNNSLLSDLDYLNITNKQIERISEIKAINALPVYNLDDVNNIPSKDIQFTINDQLFLDVLLM